MLHFVFDLDYTLYQTKEKTGFEYYMLNINPYLDRLLKAIKCNKILFTNGTFNHALKCIDLIGIKDHFPNDKIVARDTINDLKPQYSAFDKFIKCQNIKPDDHVFFFEDSVMNLMESKKYNWITFYIGDFDVNQFSKINKSFKNIEEALEYIIYKNEKIIKHPQYHTDHN